MFKRVNMFADSKASKAFYFVIDQLGEKKSKTFSDAVKKLFLKKSISENGEFHSFKIELSDIQTLKKMV